VSVQPFGIRAPGGGPRILRALFAGHEHEVLNVCTSPSNPPAAGEFLEVHLPVRRHLGRLEATRANRLMPAIDVLRGSRFARELRTLCETVNSQAIHGVAHSLDFVYAEKVARAMDVPFVLSVHDDLRGVLRGSCFRAYALRELERAWQRAEQRNVISEAMGEEYVRRYGEREYAVVTDGIEQIRPARPRAGDEVSLYFAGLMHLSYRPNVEALLRGCELYGRRHGDAAVTLRCGELQKDWQRADTPLTVLPFGDESAVEIDLDHASLLYLPLPFDSTYDDFVRFSLSTKLVTYLGSGVPILYHGPAQSAAARLLVEHDAAVVVSGLGAGEVCEGILRASVDAERIVRNAQRLAMSRFRLSEQRRVFWEGVRGSGDQATGAQRPDGRPVSAPQYA
jgi:hypothetical protein